jgi:hypothetical protein
MGRLIPLTLFFWTLAACGQPAVSWEPVPAAVIEQKAAATEMLLAAEKVASSSGDLELFQAVFTDDIVLNDETFKDEVVGIERVVRTYNNIKVLFPNLQGVNRVWFIGSEEILLVIDLWNLNLYGYPFTQDDPLEEVDLWKIHDNHIWLWDMFYGLDSLQALGNSNNKRVEEIPSLLNAYGSAWSSKNTRKVKSLYAVEAVRDDPIFGKYLEGRNAIVSDAQVFFSKFPLAQWKLGLAFGDGNGTAPITGGVWELSVIGSEGEMCDVRMAVTLKTVNGKIVSENVYYEPNSLISCGWAQ